MLNADMAENEGDGVRREPCDQIRSLLPAYALGATDVDETRLVESRLADCPGEAAELVAYRQLADRLLHSVEPVEPPLELAGRILAGLSTTPATHEPAPRPASARPSFWQRIQEAWLPSRSRTSLAMAAAALLLLVAVSLYWTMQIRQVRDQQDQLLAQLSRQGELLALVGEDDFLRIKLPAGPAAADTGAYATVVCNPQRTVGYLLAEGMPPTPPDTAYQLWLIQGEDRVSGGLFQVDQQGLGSLLFQAPEAMINYDSIGITLEPATGSPGPTSPPVIRGSLYEGSYQES